MCACLQVMWQTYPSETHPGSVYGKWTCKLCGNEFIPRGAAMYMVKEAVREAKEEVERALEEDPGPRGA